MDHPNSRTADSHNGVEVSSFHEDKDFLISKLENNIYYWVDTADYFIRRFCDIAQIDYVDAWMEYEDHLDGTASKHTGKDNYYER
jgi:hypothetical protein